MAGRLGGSAGIYGTEDYAKMFAPQAFQDAINPWQVAVGTGNTLYPGHTDQSGAPVNITQEQQGIYDNLMAQIKAIQPGTMEQSLANLFAPYGGWGIGKPLTGTGTTDLNTIFAAPDANALTQRIGLTQEQQAMIASQSGQVGPATSNDYQYSPVVTGGN